MPRLIRATLRSVQSEQVQESRGNDRFAFPVPPRLQTIPGVRLLELEVSEALDLGPRMRSIRLTGEALRDFTYQAGQDVMLVLSGGERPLSRRYTIRGYAPSSWIREWTCGC